MLKNPLASPKIVVSKLISQQVIKKAFKLGRSWIVAEKKRKQLRRVRSYEKYTTTSVDSIFMFSVQRMEASLQKNENVMQTYE